MRTKCVSALRTRSKGDISRCGSEGSANAAAARSSPYGVPWELPAMGCGYESWPKGSRNWTDVANGYLDLPQWGPPPWTELQWVMLRNVIELAEET